VEKAPSAPRRDEWLAMPWGLRIQNTCQGIARFEFGVGDRDETSNVEATTTAYVYVQRSSGSCERERWKETDRKKQTERKLLRLNNITSLRRKEVLIGGGSLLLLFACNPNYRPWPLAPLPHTQNPWPDGQRSRIIVLYCDRVALQMERRKLFFLRLRLAVRAAIDSTDDVRSLHQYHGGLCSSQGHRTGWGCTGLPMSRGNDLSSCQLGWRLSEVEDRREIRSLLFSTAENKCIAAVAPYWCLYLRSLKLNRKCIIH
jgi:hypothetical protein